MAGGAGGEDFDLWRGLQRIRRQAQAPTPEDAERMRETDYKEERQGRVMALALVVLIYLFFVVSGN